MPSAPGEMGEKAGRALWMCPEQWNGGRYLAVDV